MTRSATELDSQVRGAITRLIVADGYAPGARRLAAELGTTATAVRDSLARLADSRGLVLHPGTTDIWVAHPFALSPAPFWVATPRGSWWGNCAWCALGIAAMLGEDACITTRLGAENDPVEVLVRDGKVTPQHLLAHFAVPASRWWDNVLYTCGTILLFDSSGSIDEWCERHAIRRGETLTIDCLWRLARAWYGDYLAPDWRRHNSDEACEIFSRLGLTGPFWEPAASGNDG